MEQGVTLGSMSSFHFDLRELGGREFVHLFADDIPQSVDSFLNLFRCSVGKVEAHGIMSTAARVETLAGDKGNFLLNRRFENIL